MALGVAMGIISYCYYEEGVISKKFQFVLNQILGSRNLFQAPKMIEQASGPEVENQQNRIAESGSSKSSNSKDSEKLSKIEQNIELKAEVINDSIEETSVNTTTV